MLTLDEIDSYDLEGVGTVVTLEDARRAVKAERERVVKLMDEELTVDTMRSHPELYELRDRILAGT